MTGTVLLMLRILLAVLLYAFLGWALYTLWRDMRRQAELQAERQVRPLNLTFEGLEQRLELYPVGSDHRKRGALRCDAGG